MSLTETSTGRHPLADRAVPTAPAAPAVGTTTLPVVMIEGGTAAAFAGWEPAATAVLSRTGPVHWFRTKGPLGRRAVPTRRAPDLSTWAEELAHDTATLGPVDLAACGVGGLVALRFTLDHPERVRRLLLVDVPSPYWWVKPRAHRSMRANPDRADVVIDLRTSLGAVTEHVLAEAFGGQAIPVLPDVAMAAVRQPALFVRSPGAGLLTGGDHLARLLPNASLVVAHHDDGGCLVGDAGERAAGCGCGVVDTVARHFND